MCISSQIVWLYLSSVNSATISLAATAKSSSKNFLSPPFTEDPIIQGTSIHKITIKYEPKHKPTPQCKRPKTTGVLAIAVPRCRLSQSKREFSKRPKLSVWTPTLSVAQDRERLQVGVKSFGEAKRRRGRLSRGGERKLGSAKWYDKKIVLLKAISQHRSKVKISKLFTRRFDNKESYKALLLYKMPNYSVLPIAKKGNNCAVTLSHMYIQQKRFFKNRYH
eukprot:TRINITY_DN7418_c0_g1_i4.p1 TRINITY_DN7418_c0_g1~~TRINITY_DN7418_c0_g1_i4.p1  ORF type:complete len:221 (+),score=17.01 TRINITY_DN7418_c0_g1_i4:192-854(+)